MKCSSSNLSWSTLAPMRTRTREHHRQEPDLVWALQNKPAIPAQYRLDGPHAWEAAKPAIIQACLKQQQQQQQSKL